MTIEISDPNAFFEALKVAWEAASRDKTRPGLMAVRIQPHEGRSAVVATDSHRLCCQVLDLGWPRGAKPFGLLSTSMSNLVRRKKWEPVRIVVDGNEAVVSDAKKKDVSLPIVDDIYPEWEQHVDPINYTPCMRFNCQEMIDTIEEAMTIKESVGENTDLKHAIAVDIPYTKFIVRRYGSRFGSEQSSQGFSTVFNVDYLLCGLKAIGSGEVILQREAKWEPNKAGAFLLTGAARPGFGYALMRMSP